MAEIIAETKSKFSSKGLIIGCSIFLGITVLVLLVLGVFLKSLFITIGPDEVAVVVSPYEPDGIIQTPWTPGNHMLRPAEKVEIFKATKETYFSASTNCNCDPTPVTILTQDGVEIIMNYQVTYAIDSKQVVKLYQMWQHRYQNGFVAPKSKQVVEEIASQYTSNEIALTKREEIEKETFSRLESDFSESYLILFEFKIDDVRLNK
jgi:regulator of protease activity HflC (stomatin/prohibitin superfamily)